MTRPCRIAPRPALFFALLAGLSALAPGLASGQWTAPTPEELSMTAQPEVPGAAAVYLFREDLTEDKMHMHSVYVRLKVLSEAGKEYANVQLPYYSQTGWDSNGGGTSQGEISGRTIHPDGTIYPFTGKPYDKFIEQAQGKKFMAKVFSLPNVDVGSILEYRYKTRYGDHVFYAPRWYIQSELYTRKAHFNWKPTSETLISHEEGDKLTNSIAWTPILPLGAKLEQTRLPPMGGNDGQLIFELNLHDIEPSPHEEFMPPIESFTYRVFFYYSPYRTISEFWTRQGKHWSKEQDNFIGPRAKVATAVQQIVSSGAPATTEEHKLRKIYAAVMQLENTDFTREHSTAEEKAAGLNTLKNSDDIWERKRGNGDQLTDLFIAMARSAGMKAYAMAVTNRDRNMFLPTFLSLSQLDDLIAIVNVDGKERFFDPGQRYCPYSHLAWKHTFVQGLRQTDGATAIANGAGDSFASSSTKRIADLKMDATGSVSGTVKFVYVGAPALRWRQVALRGDETGLERDLRAAAEELLPRSLEIKVASVQKVGEYEEPLTVTFDVNGNLGSATGKRLLVPGDIFVSNEKTTFPHEKRDIAVYFQYPHINQDVVRITFPRTLFIESLPTPDHTVFLKSAAYGLSVASTPISFTVRRDYTLGDVLFPTAEYPDLRKFYTAFETRDQEAVVLKLASPAADAAPATPRASPPVSQPSPSGGSF